MPSIPYSLRRGLSRTVLITNAVRARTPPSPLLSAFNTTLTYLSKMTRTKDQKISDRTPNTCSGVTAIPGVVKQADMAYSGLVPMSPNTTPSAASAIGASRPLELLSPDIFIRAFWRKGPTGVGPDWLGD